MQSHMLFVYLHGKISDNCILSYTEKNQVRNEVNSNAITQIQCKFLKERKVIIFLNTRKRTFDAEKYSND